MISLPSKFYPEISLRRPVIPFLVGFLIWAMAGCSSVKTYMAKSGVPDHQVIIDGRSDDWAGNLSVIKDEGISLGFLNDGEYLYLCLRVDQFPVRARIMRNGLSVWFDPKGGKKKALGIKYPLGISPEEFPPPRDPYGEHQEEPDVRSLRGESWKALEIIRSKDEEPEKMEVADAEGMEIKVLPSRTGLVYELKIPLLETARTPIAVGAKAGSTIGIGFETGKMTFDAMRRRPGRMAGGGGMPPMPGRMMRGGSRFGPDFLDELKIWATVKLSEGERPEPAELR